MLWFFGAMVLRNITPQSNLCMSSDSSIFAGPFEFLLKDLKGINWLLIFRWTCLQDVWFAKETEGLGQVIVTQDMMEARESALVNYFFI